MSLYEEYESFVNTYKAEYGANAVVLYRCGQFYEMYSANDGLIDIKSISELLNIQVSRRNKSILEVNRSNTLMAGFPIFALRKFVSILVANNYTVVIVDQVSDPPKPRRAVTEVISPGTMVDGIEASESNNLMAIYLDEVTGEGVCMGAALIDITTGVSKVCEAGPRQGDKNFALDEAYRVIISYNPKEIVVFGTLQNLRFQDIVNHLEIASKCVHNKVNAFPTEVTTVNYQNQLFNKLFPNHGLYTVAEFLDLERRPFATTSYVYLLQFAMRHNEAVMNMISRPSILTENDNLIIEYNALRQLNIVHSNDQKQNSLLHILNRCRTAIGRRFFKDVLLNPVTSPSILEKRYDEVDALLNGKAYEVVTRELSRMYDLERLARKMAMNRMHPADFCQVHDTVEAVIALCTIRADICNDLFGFSDHKHVNDMKAHYTNTIDISEAGKYHLDNIEGSFFKKGVYPSIDDLQEKMNAIMTSLARLVEGLNEGNDGFFKLDNNEREGFYLQITSKRFNEVKEKLSSNTLFIMGIQFSFKDLSTKSVSATSSCLKLTHKALAKATEAMTDLKTKLRAEALQEFKKFVKSFVETHRKTLDKLVSFIGRIDVGCTHAENAAIFRYSRPSLVCGEESAAEIKDIRHPIIERVFKDTEYVRNDIHLNKEMSGMLLFGLNCSGKTSLSKAVALNIIMAQCGSFVPCQLSLTPFKSIFTRIPSGDDIFKSMSTFAVEMSELRNILRRADKYSLIVGDEISHGTEVTSGVAIVSAAIMQLAERRSKFIFATHLHNIVGIKRVTDLPNISMKHLSVHYDESLQTLVYDRKLRDGAGSSVYGLEVCRSLDLPRDYLELANSIRCESAGIETNIVSLNKSRYNAGIFVDTCEICGVRSDEVHHIKERYTADSAGFVGSTHMNAKHNLMNVCESCHDKIHSKKVKVKGYVQTGEGVRLSWEKDAPEDKTGVIELMRELKGKGMSIAAIMRAVNETYPSEKVTVYRVKKALTPSQTS